MKKRKLVRGGGTGQGCKISLPFEDGTSQTGKKKN